MLWSPRLSSACDIEEDVMNITSSEDAARGLSNTTVYLRSDISLSPDEKPEPFREEPIGTHIHSRCARLGVELAS